MIVVVVVIVLVLSAFVVIVYLKQRRAGSGLFECDTKLARIRCVRAMKDDCEV